MSEQGVPAPKAVDDALKNPTYETNRITGKREQVFPCKCGETHRGDYGIYDFGHHNCTHLEYPLREMDEDAICIQCGAVFDGDDLPLGATVVKEGA